MMKKTLAIGFLSLALSACESSTTENATKPAATPAATPAVAATPETSPSVPTATIKVGDKVKVKINGTTSDATVVSIDEKAGKATVRIEGQKEDKSVPITDIVKQ